MLDVSWETIGKILLAGLILYVLFLSRDIIIWAFFAIIISILVEPAINWLRWLKLPKIISVILVYVSIFGVLGFLIYVTAPIFIFEINQLSQNIPTYFEKINPILTDLGVGVSQNFDQFSASLIDKLNESSGSILKSVAVFFGGITSTAFIFTLAFFISLEEKGPEHLLVMVTPKRYEDFIIRLFERSQIQVSGWFGARIIACVAVGVASFILFFLFGVKYAFILALISGVLNFIPYVGPTVTLFVAVLFAGITNSWLIALYVLIGLLVIQEIENKFLTPLLMKRFMDMPPSLVLLSLVVGHAVFGFLGMIFIVPMFGIGYEFAKEFLERKKEEQESYA